MTPDSPPPKVAYVAYSFPVLTQTFTVREVVALRQRGLPVTVFATRSDPDSRLDPEAESERVRTHYLPRALSPAAVAAAFGWLARRPVRFLVTLAQCLGGGYRDDALRCRLRASRHFVLGAALASALRRAGGFTRIHAQFVDAGSTVAFTAARLTDTPFSFMNHTAYNPYLLPVKARHAEVALSISEFDRDRVVAECGTQVRDRVVVNRVGIRVADWTGLARQPEPGRVLVVGALRPKKGHDVLLRAAALLATRGVVVELVFAGAGADEQSLRDLAASLVVDIEFLGPVGPSVVQAQLARARVFALPCRRASNGDVDGIPVALMEAMAAGVPVVSTRLSGVPELVEDGVSGLLAEPGDPETLARALERVLLDDALAGRLAAAGVEQVRALHDLDVTSASLARALVGPGPPRRAVGGLV